MNTATTFDTIVRDVYRLDDGSQLCGACLNDTAEPTRAWVSAESGTRDDSLHCLGCDYHADPTCGPRNWCAQATMMFED